MNKIYLAAFSFTLLLGGCSASDNDDGTIRMYQEKSGIVTSVYDDRGITEYLVWDNWGLNIAKYQFNDDGTGTKSIINLEVRSGRVELDGAALVELPSGEYEEQPYPQINIISQLSEDSLGNLAEAFIKAVGLWENSGNTKEVAGKTCDLWVNSINPNHTNCLWQGIIIETYAEIYTKTASAVTISDNIDSAHFDFPGLLQVDY